VEYNSKDIILHCQFSTSCLPLNYLFSAGQFCFLKRISLVTGASMSFVNIYLGILVLLTLLKSAICFKLPVVMVYLPLNTKFGPHFMM
jgi:hypothetical protein